ncbi:MAG TPA: class I SAM-dependent methyltransferase [Gammaproteobacteria bacterium]|nr:class I SAM-dependent methyltransferase [Gammaproteobacteria bacterium]
MILKPGREKSLLRRHPWVFSGAVERVDGASAPGDSVAVEAGDGRFLGWAALSPASQIRARVWSWQREIPIGPELIASRIATALAHRRRLLGDADSLRLLHGEADGLPGCVCDRYGDRLVLQLLSCGADRWRDTLVAELRRQTGLAQIHERSDSEVVALEGLPPRNATLAGAAMDTPAIASEHDLRYSVDVRRGHKTGFYLDQRDNRLLARRYADGVEALDCFCYTGGFTANLLAGGARHVVAIDSSADALALAKFNVETNALDASRVDFVAGDVFKHLRTLRDRARHFDLIVLDPPKFAPTAAFAEKAARGYKDINLLALKLLKPGGLLFTFSCSGGVDRALFQKIIAGAASDAGVDARIVHQLAAGADHPIATAFPEGEYLKGFVLQV